MGLKKRKFGLRFKLSTLLAVMVLLALIMGLVVAPEIRRTAAFEELNVINPEDLGFALRVMGPVPDGWLIDQNEITPPNWFLIRQRIASTLGIKTTPWHSLLLVKTSLSGSNVGHIKCVTSVQDLQFISMSFSCLNAETVELLRSAENLKSVLLFLPEDSSEIEPTDLEIPELDHLEVYCAVFYENPIALKRLADVKRDFKTFSSATIEAPR